MIMIKLYEVANTRCIDSAHPVVLSIVAMYLYKRLPLLVIAWCDTRRYYWHASEIEYSVGVWPLLWHNTWHNTTWISRSRYAEKKQTLCSGRNFGTRNAIAKSMQYVFLLISCQTCNQRRNGNLITSLSLSPNYLRDILNNLFLQNCSVKLLWWAVLGSTLPLRYIYLDSLGLLKSPNVMTVVVLMDLEPGPYEHDLPFDYPNFDNLELNSGIYLMSVFISILFL